MANILGKGIVNTPGSTAGITSLDAIEYASQISADGGSLESIGPVLLSFDSMYQAGTYYKSKIILPMGMGYKANFVYAWNPVDRQIVKFDFSRAGTKTRVNSSGLIEQVPANTLAQDFLINPAGDSLVEPQRRNLLTYSKQFDNAAWTKRGTVGVTANDTTAPDGTVTADLITNLGTSTNDVFQVVTGTSNAFAEPSVYILKGSATGVISLKNPSTSARGDWSINLSLIGSGWERIDVNSAAVTVNTTFQNNVGGGNGIQLARVSGSGDFHVWGAQLEEGSYPTSYIPTVASTVTRNQDVISLTGASALLGDSAGGLFVEAAWFRGIGGFSLYDGTTNNRVSLLINVGTDILRLFVAKDGNTQSSITTTINFNQFYKAALRYSPDDFAFYNDGTLIGTDASGETYSSGTLSDVAFNIGTAAQPFYGRISQLQIMHQAPTDTELSNLTS